jgi:hypothetical protein
LRAIAQVVDSLPSKCKALRSIPHTAGVGGGSEEGNG